jgi:hypothetical protein
MKKIIYGTISSLLLASFLSGCFYDEEAVFVGLPTNVSLNNDVIPIFNASCNTSGCHDAAGSHSPILVGEQAYNALVSGQFINTVEPEKSRLYLELNAGMPPSGPLSTNEMKIILGWITDGAKNN